MSTINMVKYFFYRGHLPQNEELLQQLVRVAYQTARDRKLYPKAILIRSKFHNTTTIDGKHQVDPLGWHVTLCYKDEDQASKGTHVASHGYVMGQFDLDFKKATHAGEKVDTWKKRTGGIVWPPAEDLEEAPEIGYGHFPQDD